MLDLLTVSISFMGIPGGSAIKNLPLMQEMQVQSLGREDPLEKEMQPTPVLLPGKSHGQRSPVVYSPWGGKESDTTKRRHFLIAQLVKNLPAMQETPVQFLGWEDLLEKG